MVAVLQYITIIKIGAQRAQRSLFAQPRTYTTYFGLHKRRQKLCEVLFIKNRTRTVVHEVFNHFIDRKRGRQNQIQDRLDRLVGSLFFQA